MSDLLEFVRPQGGVVCLPRIRKEIKIDTGTFYSFLYRELKTMVGPGHWFGMDDRCFRLGYGWPGEAEFTAGLANIEKALKTASS
ncbi:MAG: aspartate aminotransferase [Bacteroidetes bacterium]|nr:MAG: aspartate aminotransferase [Bacteroidota bacterium]